MSRIPLVAIFALSLCSPGYSARSGPATLPREYARKVVPFVDEASKEPALDALRKNLIEDVRAARTDALLSVIPADFQELRDLVGAAGSAKEMVAKSDYLRPLLRSLQFGGSFTTTRGAVSGRREFCAPFAFSAYPEAVSNELLEISGHPWVVLSSKATVYQEPSAKSSPIGQVGYELVPVQARYMPDKSGANLTWQFVQLSNGRWGWMEASLLWEYDGEAHICFAQVNGKWVISAFNEGQ